MDKKWEEMTWQEKREERFKRWLSLDIKFNSPEAERLYKERVTRFIKVIKLNLVKSQMKITGSGNN